MFAPPLIPPDGGEEDKEAWRFLLSSDRNHALIVNLDYLDFFTLVVNLEKNYMFFGKISK